jgi:hypothetical protein
MVLLRSRSAKFPFHIQDYLASVLSSYLFLPFPNTPSLRYLPVLTNYTFHTDAFGLKAQVHHHK